MRGSIEVHRYLTERAITHEFYSLGRPLRRLDEAAALLGLRAGQVVAAEMFESPRGMRLALIPASDHTSAAVVAKAAGESHLVAAAPSRVTEHTGFMAGWLPPVGHERPARCFVDVRLATMDVLYAPGGDPGVLLVIRAEDLIRATSAATTELVTAPAAVRTARDPSLLAG